MWSEYWRASWKTSAFCELYCHTPYINVTLAQQLIKCFFFFLFLSPRTVLKSTVYFLCKFSHIFHFLIRMGKIYNYGKGKAYGGNFTNHISWCYCLQPCIHSWVSWSKSKITLTNVFIEISNPFYYFDLHTLDLGLLPTGLEFEIHEISS